MSFRSRLIIAFVVATIVPLAVLALGVRRQLGTRLVAQHERRVQGLAHVVEQDLARESASIASRLASLGRTLRADDRFRLAAVRGDPAERAYLLDLGESAMRVAGLEMLQLQDDRGRILSSGHFRNEFDRLEPELPRLLASARTGALVRARAPEGPFLALARVDSVFVAGRRFDLVGGVKVDSQFLRRFEREDGLRVSLALTEGEESAPATVTTAGAGVVSELTIPYVHAGDSSGVLTARLVVEHTVPELQALRRGVDRWFAGAVALVVAMALGLAAWLSARMSRPLATLIQAASTIDLDGPRLAIAAERDDEIGTLARRMSGMSNRLRASAAKLRDAERRATVGDLARQVNHDIKNGLIPIRNVLRHLVQVQEQQPQELATVFGERRSTLESSVGYLDTLARSYARLSPRVEHRAVNVNEIAAELAASTVASDGITLRARLGEGIPRVLGDAVAVRRILDNLVRNAVESLGPGGGEVMIASSRAASGGVRVVVADTGKGMSEEELAHAFDDFFTTKPDGTGLGLSVVRRLTADLHGSVRVESAPGRGTTVTLELPAAP